MERSFLQIHMHKIKFVILNASEVPTINFYEVEQDNAEVLRFNVNKSILQQSKTFVKFSGDTPSFLEGKPTLTLAEMKEELKKKMWNSPL